MPTTNPTEELNRLAADTSGAVSAARTAILEAYLAGGSTRVNAEVLDALDSLLWRVTDPAVFAAFEVIANERRRRAYMDMRPPPTRVPGPGVRRG